MLSNVFLGDRRANPLAIVEVRGCGTWQKQTRGAERMRRQEGLECCEVADICKIVTVQDSDEVRRRIGRCPQLVLQHAEASLVLVDPELRMRKLGSDGRIVFTRLVHNHQLGYVWILEILGNRLLQEREPAHGRNAYANTHLLISIINI